MNEDQTVNDNLDMKNEEQVSESENLDIEDKISEPPYKVEMDKIMQNLLTENQKLNKLVEELKNQEVLLKLTFQDMNKKAEDKVKVAIDDSIKKFGSKMISVLNIIDLAKKSCQQDQNMLIGIEMIEKQFLEIFESFNITKVPLKIGDEFDANICEAIADSEDESMVSSEQKSGSNNIKKIISFPYLFNKQLLVPGKVIV